MTLIKKKLKKDLFVQYNNGNVEHYKNGDELDVIEEVTTAQCYYVAFDV